MLNRRKLFRYCRCVSREKTFIKIVEIIIVMLSSPILFHEHNIGVLILGFYGGYLLVLALLLGCYTVWMWTMFPMFRRCLHLQGRSV
jgi:hypothetical protein